MVARSAERPVGQPWARRDAHVNWELNERVSLSSAGSSGRDEPAAGPRPSSLSRPLGKRAAAIERIDAERPPGTPVQRRWRTASEHLERTNDALARRLSVIQELNRKILASHERARGPSGPRPWRKPEEQLGGGGGGLVAERRRALGERLSFRRRAGGEWSLPGAPPPPPPPLPPPMPSGPLCTLRRPGPEDRGARGEVGPAPPGPSATSSPVPWAGQQREQPREEEAEEEEEERPPTQEETSALRELNEAIDRFEEEEDRRRARRAADGPKGAASGHDSSWDSGVGAELSSCGAAGRQGSGWLRVHTGAESSLVYLTLETGAGDVCRDMLLSENLALYVQYGDEPGRRLSSRERPLELQEELLRALGYREATRRARLGLDAELQHLIRFHVGPSAPLEELRGYSRCGYALVLKGLVFPQWKKRALAVIGSRLFLYPACPESRPEWMELSDGGSVCCAPSRLGRLVLRVSGYPARSQQQQQQQQHQQHGTSGQREEEPGARPETRHLYIGFHHPWDRELWRGWLKRASSGHRSTSAATGKLDMSETGLARLPEAARAFAVGTRELLLGRNQLARLDGNLELLHSFPELRRLHLEENRLCEFPGELLSLENLTFLDLSDNKLQEIPEEIVLLSRLRELILDRNEIKRLPERIGELRQLEHISLAGNLIEILPGFLLEMRALALANVLPGRSGGGDDDAAPEDRSNLHNGAGDGGGGCLNKVNLRNNQLKGNIILGNYGNLTHLDLSENSIEKLDLSALQELRSVRCARNVLTELTLCGRSLESLIAGNNKLKKLTIVPVPANLEHLDVSYNELDSLPDWTPDLPVLRALFASHNRLTCLPERLLSQQASSRLEVLHLPHNRLQALPPPRRPLGLVHLTLQDNELTALPDGFFARTPRMKVLNLSNNRLTELPMYNRAEDAAAAAAAAAANGIGQRRRRGSSPDRAFGSLEKLYLTGNSLTNTALDALARFRALRVLHLAYNALDALPESCIAAWRELEELVLSGNKLQYLPDNVANLAHLRVLRVHSNRLLTCPAFNKTSSLKVLDLAHNHLDRLNLDDLLSAQLQFLDISCNSRLRVDPSQFQTYNSARRPLSLVDVSGQGGAGPPPASSSATATATTTTAVAAGGAADATPRGSSSSRRKDPEQRHLPWRLGFSETAGTRERLLASQVRMPSFCGQEGLFGLFDGASNQEAPGDLQEIIPRLLLEERAAKETRAEYLRYTMLSAQRELRERGRRRRCGGVDAALVHLTRRPGEHGALAEEGPRYLLTAATCGEARAVLCRASGPLQLARGSGAQYVPRLHRGPGKGGHGDQLPVAPAEPTSEEVLLEDDDEFVIIGNRRLWEVLGIEEAVREARAEANPVLAAKRLQDLGQAYGAEDNLSVLVVRLSVGGPERAPVEPLSRLLMRELRQAVHTKQHHQHQHQQQPRTEGGSCTCPCCMPRLAAHETPAACCCHAVAAAAATGDRSSGAPAPGGGGGGFDSAGSSVNGFYLNGVVRNLISARSSGKSSRSSQRAKDGPTAQPIGPTSREERSSPSGQSDQTSEAGLFEPRGRKRASGRGDGATSRFCKLRQQQQQQQQQLQASASVVVERAPPPSDEQLRCWEYMLEQNTQLLFDKELDTLTSVTRSGNGLRRGQSRSTPQLGVAAGGSAGIGAGGAAGVPFLSRRFGSARSFDASPSQHRQQQQQQLLLHQHQAPLQPAPTLMLGRPGGGGGVGGGIGGLPLLGPSGRRLLNGGPNAAYFGSLQRLMPYNLEYDFAVIQERAALDSLEQDASRMQQYWGVATTEL